MSVSEQYAVAVVSIYLGLLCTGALVVLSVGVVTILGWALTSRILHRLRRVSPPAAGRRASRPASQQSHQVSTGTVYERPETTSCSTQSPWR
jgi:hypothetical protein